MSFRIRQCVECPKCRTYYLIAFSPYKNGSYLVRSIEGSREEYTLYCFCDGGQFPCKTRWLKAKSCEVSKAAHGRGYGSLNEIWPATPETRPEPSFDLSRYLNLRPD